MQQKFAQHTYAEMLKLASISAHRLGRLIEINAPTVIIHNERRLLDERLDEIAFRNGFTPDLKYLPENEN